MVRQILAFRYVQYLRAKKAAAEAAAARLQAAERAAAERREAEAAEARRLQMLAEEGARRRAEQKEAAKRKAAEEAEASKRRSEAEAVERKKAQQEAAAAARRKVEEEAENTRRKIEEERAEAEKRKAEEEAVFLAALRAKEDEEIERARNDLSQPPRIRVVLRGTDIELMGEFILDMYPTGCVEDHDMDEEPNRSATTSPRFLGACTLHLHANDLMNKSLSCKLTIDSPTLEFLFSSLEEPPPLFECKTLRHVAVAAGAPWPLPGDPELIRQQGDEHGWIDEESLLEALDAVEVDAERLMWAQVSHDRRVQYLLLHAVSRDLDLFLSREHNLMKLKYASTGLVLC